MEVQQKPFEVLEAELEKYYDIRGREEVKSFLETRPYLEEPLLAIPGKLEEYFGYTKKPKLFVVPDVELPSDTGLDVNVHTNLGAEKVLEIKERLNEDWWIDVSLGIRHQIVLSVY
jgi:hypothetical protein